jgi:hypothetical protein
MNPGSIFFVCLVYLAIGIFIASKYDERLNKPNRQVWAVVFAYPLFGAILAVKGLLHLIIGIWAVVCEAYE